MSRERQAMVDLSAAEGAMSGVEASLKKFKHSCLGGDWPAVEQARFEAVSMFEAYLDAMSSAYVMVHNGE